MSRTTFGFAVTEIHPRLGRTRNLFLSSAYYYLEALGAR